MRRLLICLALAFTHLAHGEERGLSELNFAPAFGYSNFSGFVYGGTLALALPLSHCFQWETGGMLLIQSSAADPAASGIFTGPLFNFGEDPLHSYFLGAGIGFSNTFPFGSNDRPTQKLAYGYAKVGKRFVLNNAGSFLLRPELEFLSTGENRSGAINFEPLQFTWVF